MTNLKGVGKMSLKTGLYHPREACLSEPTFHFFNGDLMRIRANPPLLGDGAFLPAAWYTAAR